MSDLSAGEVVGGLSAPTLERQGDAESREELRAELVELLRRYGLQIPTAQRWVGDFERAVERRIRESIAGEIEAAGEIRCLNFRHCHHERCWTRRFDAEIARAVSS